MISFILSLINNNLLIYHRYELGLEQKQKLRNRPTIQNAILLKLIPRLRLTRSGIFSSINRASPKRARKMAATFNYSSTMVKSE